MRVILFRGKDSLGNWRFGSLVYKACESRWKDNYYATRGMDNRAINRGNYYIIDSSGDGYWIALNTIGQYTGLTDIHGKAIYEGDIVEHTAFCDETIRVGYVEYVDRYGAFFIKGSGYSDNQMYAFFNFKVIGNIYDNPELLTPGVE